MTVTCTKVVRVLTIVLTCEHCFQFVQNQRMMAQEIRVAEETVYRVLLVADVNHDVAWQWP